jgi:hypothetical protein
MVASESETAETEAEFLVSQFVNPPITAGINKIIIPIRVCSHFWRHAVVRRGEVISNGVQQPAEEKCEEQRIRS